MRSDVLEMFCWCAMFQKCMCLILIDAETLLPLLATRPVPLRTGCFAPTRHILGRNMHESIRRDGRMPFIPFERVLCWSKCLVLPQSCTNHCVLCAHTSVQTHRLAENGYLVGNKGVKGWLSEKKAC